MNVKDYVSLVLKQVHEGMAEGGVSKTVEVTFDLEVSPAAKIDGVDGLWVDRGNVKFWAFTNPDGPSSKKD